MDMDRVETIDLGNHGNGQWDKQRTFKDLDRDSWLVVLISGEVLGDGAWNARVSLNQLVHHTANRLKTQRQRNNVHKENVLDGLAGVARENGSLEIMVRFDEKSLKDRELYFKVWMGFTWIAAP